MVYIAPLPPKQRERRSDGNTIATAAAPGHHAADSHARQRAVRDAPAAAARKQQRQQGAPPKRRGTVDQRAAAPLGLDEGLVRQAEIARSLLERERQLAQRSDGGAAVAVGQPVQHLSPPQQQQQQQQQQLAQQLPWQQQQQQQGVVTAHPQLTAPVVTVAAGRVGLRCHQQLAGPTRRFDATQVAGLEGSGEATCLQPDPTTAAAAAPASAAAVSAQALVQAPAAVAAAGGRPVANVATSGQQGAAAAATLGVGAFEEEQRRTREARQRQYKAELEAMIAQREAARRAAEAAERQRGAAEAALRCSAPPPWDPEARVARPGGGGEPHRDALGQPVADLRAARSAVLLGTAPQQQQAAGPDAVGLAPVLSAAPSGSAAAWCGQELGYPHHHQQQQPSETQQQQHAKTASLPGGRPFMAALTELRPGPSAQQRAAAAAARQRLLADLDAQVAAKAAARATAERAEAARMSGGPAAATAAAAPVHESSAGRMAGGIPSDPHEHYERLLSVASGFAMAVAAGGNSGGGDCGTTAPGDAPVGSPPREAGWWGPQAQAATQLQQGSAAVPPPPVAFAPAMARRRSGRPLLDAPWLDEAAARARAAAASCAGPADNTACGTTTGATPLAMMASAGLLGPDPSWGGHMPAAAAAGVPATAPSALPREASSNQQQGRADSAALGSLLRQLQADAAAMRADLDRQAAALEGLVHSKAAAVEQREVAREELRRVRRTLAANGDGADAAAVQQSRHQARCVEQQRQQRQQKQPRAVVCSGLAAEVSRCSDQYRAQQALAWQEEDCADEGAAGSTLQLMGALGDDDAGPRLDDGPRASGQPPDSRQFLVETVMVPIPGTAAAAGWGHAEADQGAGGGAAAAAAPAQRLSVQQQQQQQQQQRRPAWGRRVPPGPPRAGRSTGGGDGALGASWGKPSQQVSCKDDLCGSFMGAEASTCTAGRAPRDQEVPGGRGQRGGAWGSPGKTRAAAGTKRSAAGRAG